MGLKADETLIPIKKTTRDKLKALGKKGETYDHIITEILSFNYPLIEKIMN